jgi:hypothetical protein
MLFRLLFIASNPKKLILKPWLVYQNVRCDWPTVCFWLDVRTWESPLPFCGNPPPPRSVIGDEYGDDCIASLRGLRGLEEGLEAPSQGGVPELEGGQSEEGADGEVPAREQQGEDPVQADHRGCMKVFRQCLREARHIPPWPDAASQYREDSARKRLEGSGGAFWSSAAHQRSNKYNGHKNYCGFRLRCENKTHWELRHSIDFGTWSTYKKLWRLAMKLCSFRRSSNSLRDESRSRVRWGFWP